MTAILAIGPVIWAIDGVNSTLGWLRRAPLWYEASNDIRLLSGMANGLAVGCLLYPIYHGVLWSQSERKRILARKWPLAVLILGGLVLTAVMLLWKSAPYALWVLVSVGATIAALTLTNTLLIVLLLGKEGLAHQWTELLPYYLLGLLATVGETASLAIVRRMVGA